MTLHVLAASFLTSILSGFVPLVNGEAVAVAAALLLGPGELAALIAACTGGQMLAKLSLYGLARWSPRHLPERAKRALARVEGRKRGRGAVLLVLASAGVGVPPFYLVTLGAGAVGLPLAAFAGAGLVGTVLRYSVLVWGATRIASGAGLPIF